MERIVYRLTLDLHKNGIQRTLQGFETADKMARRISINLMSNGDTYEIPSNNVAALIYVTTPNSKEPEIHECTVEGNALVYDMLPITEEGITEMQVKLVETSLTGARKVIASPRWAVEVTKSGMEDGGAEQTEKFTALENAIARANGVYDARLVRIVIDDDCTFRAIYADGTIYENDALNKALFNGNALLSESWAIGDTGTRDGEDTNNSKYFAAASRSAAQDANQTAGNARELLDEAMMHSVYTVFDVDYETGELLYVSRNYNFDIDPETGNLTTDGGELYIPNIDETIAGQVTSWLDEHPEATTTVNDGSIGIEKFTNDAKLYAVKDYITPEMFGAVGDGVTDDSQAFHDAIMYATQNATTIIMGAKTYLFTKPLVFDTYVGRFRMIGSSKADGNKATILKYTGDGYFITFNASCSFCIFENFNIKGNRNNCGIISNGTLAVTNFDNIAFSDMLTNINIHKKSGYVRFYSCNFSMSKDDGTCVILGYPETLVGTASDNNVEYVYFTECNFEGGFLNSKAVAIYFGQFIYFDKCDICNWNDTGILLYSDYSNHFVKNIIVTNLSAIRNGKNLHVINNSTDGVFDSIVFRAQCMPKDNIEPSDRIIVIEGTNLNAVNALNAEVDCRPLNNDYDFELKNITSGVVRIVRAGIGRILQENSARLKIELPCIKEEYVVQIPSGTTVYEHILNNNSPYTRKPFLLTHFMGSTPYKTELTNTYGGVLKVKYTFSEALPEHTMMYVKTSWAVY